MEREKKQKSPTLKQKQSQPLSSELKKRILEVKERLPSSGLTSLIVFKFPEYDNVKKRSLISNVLQLRQTDEDITEKLEDLAKSLEQENNQ